MEIFGVRLLVILGVYLVLTFLLTLFMIVKMYVVAFRANDKKKGKERRIELIREGRWMQMPLYSMEECAYNKHLSYVRITVFKNDKVKNGKCAIVLPGGGYAHTIKDAEGYAIAAHLNDMGITAIVLEYRAGLHCSDHAPMQDLARTVQYMFEHKDELEIDPTDYALVGFSAGGNLAGIFGSKIYGYEKYGVEKPGCLILGYPWTNINHWMDHPYWNIWDGLIGVWFSERGNLFMFGWTPTSEQRESLCVQNWIDDDFPKTYMFTGDDDIIVRSGSHTDVLAKAFKKHNVPYKYQQFYRVPHGVGIGKGTNAEGWLEEAVQYWESDIEK